MVVHTGPGYLPIMAEAVGWDSDARVNLEDKVRHLEAELQVAKADALTARCAAQELLRGAVPASIMSDTIRQPQRSGKYMPNRNGRNPYGSLSQERSTTPGLGKNVWRLQLFLGRFVVLANAKYPQQATSC